MTGGALDGFHRGAGYQTEHVPGFQADVLHPKVTGDMIGNFAKRVLEPGIQQPSAGTFFSFARATDSRSPSSSLGMPQQTSVSASRTGMPLCSNTLTRSSPSSGSLRLP